MAEQLKPKNFDDIFLRNVIVGLASFMYDIIKIGQVVNGKSEEVKVPMFYSMSGDRQFLQDFYLNTDKYCKELRPLEGNVNQIPSGIFSIKSPAISKQDQGADYSRLIYNRLFEDEIADNLREMSARGTLIPILISFNCKIKCSTEIQRFAIWQKLVRKFRKAVKFYIRFEGFNKLPCLVAFPDTYELDQVLKFRFPDGKEPTIQFSIDLLTYLPDIDESTERFRGEKIEEYTKRIQTKDIE